VHGDRLEHALPEEYFTSRPRTRRPYVGDGFTFVSGFDGRSFMPTSSLWRRRDLIMAIRYGVHAVQQEFPGTQPLGLGEASLPDAPRGRPPERDALLRVERRRVVLHPRRRSALGQLSYRQICNDATSLDDWSCVDQDNSHGQFASASPAAATGTSSTSPGRRGSWRRWPRRGGCAWSASTRRSSTSSTTSSLGSRPRGRGRVGRALPDDLGQRRLVVGLALQPHATSPSSPGRVASRTTLPARLAERPRSPLPAWYCLRPEQNEGRDARGAHQTELIELVRGVFHPDRPRATGASRCWSTFLTRRCPTRATWRERRRVAEAWPRRSAAPGPSWTSRRCCSAPTERQGQQRDLRPDRRVPEGAPLPAMRTGSRRRWHVELEALLARSTIFIAMTSCRPRRRSRWRAGAGRSAP